MISTIQNRNLQHLILSYKSCWNEIYIITADLSCCLDVLSIDCEWIQAFSWAVDVFFNIFFATYNFDIYFRQNLWAVFTRAAPRCYAKRNFVFTFQLNKFSSSISRILINWNASKHRKDQPSKALSRCKPKTNRNNFPVAGDLQSSGECLSFDRKIYLVMFNQFKDEKHFDEKVLKSKTPVVVDFFATWCNPCKMLTPRIETVVSEHNGKVSLAKVSCYRVDSTR